jgi:hypothetical protein
MDAWWEIGVLHLRGGPQPYISCKYGERRIFSPKCPILLNKDCNLWSSDFLPRRCSHGGISVLEFDRVSEDMLPRSDSFNDNGFASGKLLWRSEKLLISDGAASSSGVVVICLPSLWRSLWWCRRRRRIDACFLHRFILSFQFCKVCSFVTCNLFLSYE